MENNRKIIYLDNNATTPIDKRVLDAMMPYLIHNFANASSTHPFGVSVNEAIKNARIQMAELIGADANEIIFTSGSTEAINLAIKGVAEYYAENGKHIVTVATEHPAVIDTCKYLETKGYEVTYLPVRHDGLINLDELKGVLRKDTILVTVMMANNETGVLQPIKEIAELSHAVGAFFMTDATQAVGKIRVDVDALGVDLLCMSGHKIYAPKGVGILYVRKRMNQVKLSAQLHGGGHENGLRSGTLNVPGIIGLGIACKIANIEMNEDAKRIVAFRDELETKLLKIKGSSINGNVESRIYNVSNICFRGFDANVMIGRMRNIAVSNGSACSSATLEPSHVLSAMGLTSEDAFSSIRFSWGKFNKENEVKAVVKIFNELFV